MVSYFYAGELKRPTVPLSWEGKDRFHQHRTKRVSLQDFAILIIFFSLLPNTAKQRDLTLTNKSTNKATTTDKNG